MSAQTGSVRSERLCEGEAGVRKPLTLPLLIVVGSLVLPVAGCGDNEDGGTGESPGQAPQAEQEPGSADGDARVLWPAPPDPIERTVVVTSHVASLATASSARLLDRWGRRSDNPGGAQ
jgi:hypothetical protein